jgi:hypothetical protein
MDKTKPETATMLLHEAKISLCADSSTEADLRTSELGNI